MDSNQENVQTTEPYTLKESIIDGILFTISLILVVMAYSGIEWLLKIK